MKAFWPRLMPMTVPVTEPVPLLIPFSSRWISMPRNWRAGPRFVILYVSENLAMTSISLLVMSSGYNIEMSSRYRSIRIPSLRR